MVKSTKRLTTSQFVSNAIAVHGYRYSYDETVYRNSKTPVVIKCPVHGYFEQTPNKHVDHRHGCPKCGGTMRISLAEFVQQAVEVHGDIYDYSKAVYRSSATPLVIGCPMHGFFSMRPNNHVAQRQGCPRCSFRVRNQEEFIELSETIHGGKYDYSRAEYLGSTSKVEIICPVHGSFMQTPVQHYGGHGCYYCGNESFGEKEVAKILSELGFQFEREKGFEGLKYKQPLRFDFYLTGTNILIEHHGAQHFRPCWGKQKFEIVQRRDAVKESWAREHGFKLIVVTYKDCVAEMLRSLLEVECGCTA